MSDSFKTAPHFYLQREFDMAALAEKKQEVNSKILDIKITYTDLLLKAIAFSLEKHPLLNASWDSHGIRLFEELNIGFAVASESGLLVVVIKNCDRKSIKEIAEERQMLIQKARNNALEPADIQNGTFTLTNLGMYQVDNFMPILNPPQSGILAAGQICEKPVIRDGKIDIRLMMAVTLAADHRVVDGAEAAEFLQTLNKGITENFEIFK